MVSGSRCTHLDPSPSGREPSCEGVIRDLPVDDVFSGFEPMHELVLVECDAEMAKLHAILPNSTEMVEIPRKLALHHVVVAELLSSSIVWLLMLGSCSCVGAESCTIRLVAHGNKLVMVVSCSIRSFHEFCYACTAVIQVNTCNRASGEKTFLAHATTQGSVVVVEQRLLRTNHVIVLNVLTRLKPIPTITSNLLHQLNPLKEDLYHTLLACKWISDKLSLTICQLWLDDQTVWQHAVPQFRNYDVPYVCWSSIRSNEYPLEFFPIELPPSGITREVLLQPLLCT